MRPEQPGDDEERPAGALVRPYALVRGRTRVGDRAPLALEALVEVVPGQRAATPTVEQQAILAHAARPVSVAELAAHLHVPVGVARVLVGELLDAGVVHVHEPGAADLDSPAERALLERVLLGLERL